ncbi:1791_t:CDS:2 [Acaulospora morrowiae]|uniref:1791_t:CDS:1 n=1 Tax=Acaulospora morrowiae TaxID=94023 RepID=A0A9N8ZEP7_9GLOM|nr:1791_t:CDS:2 [Acaulospora morrowiae]
MNNNLISSVSSKPTLSAPVKPEVRQQQHQRSKSLKGKRTPAYNRPKESLSSEVPTPSRSKNTPSHNHVDHFDSSATDSNSVDPSGVISNESHLSGFAFDNKKSVSRKSSERRPRRHQYSDSVEEIRNVPTVSILKRPQSATDFVKTSNGTSLNTTNTKTLLDVTREELEFSHPLPSANVDDHSKERRRSDAASSKVKRVQRRKEIKSVAEALQVVESETIPSFSPPKANRYLHNQPDFHEESDVNSVLNPSLESLSNSPITESDRFLVHPQANNAFVFPPLNYSNAIIALEEEMSNKHDDNLDLSNVKSSFERPLAKGYKRRSDIYPPVNAPVVPENLNRRASSASVELQSHVAPFADQDSMNEHQSSEHLLSTTPSRRLSNSPNRHMSAKLYAGPTFHNSPAPGDLPLPSFLGKTSSKESSPAMSNASLSAVTPSRTSSPSLSSGNSSDDDMFVMDEFESNPRESIVLRKQRSRELLRMLSSNSGKQNTAAAYMVPERMATSHNPTQVYPAMSLTEISESLRNLICLERASERKFSVSLVVLPFGVTRVLRQRLVIILNFF